MEPFTPHVHCKACREDVPVTGRSIVSRHHTSQGPIAYVRCPAGHIMLVEFAGVAPSSYYRATREPQAA